MWINMRGVSNEKKKKAESSAAAMSQSSSLRGIMILVTMRMIGLPVEVHVKDGSVYSGIFDAASVDGGYGVVLKKARLLKRGTRVSNIASGIIVDTLWVLPGDLIQVVAKDVVLSADGVSSGMVCDDDGAVDITKASVHQYSETDEVSADVDVDKEKLKMNHKRQEAGAYVNGAVNGYSLQKSAIVENQSSLSSKLLVNERPLENGGIPDAKSLPNGHSTLTVTDIPCREVCSSVSKPTKPVGNIISKKNHASADVLVASQNKVTTRKVQESKLNPGAKAFSPSTVNVRSVAPAVSSMTYVQNNHRMVAITPQPEDGIRPMAPHSSVTSKLVPPGNFSVANGGNGLQYAQPVQFTGHIANRAQPIRYNGQYQPVQAGVPYMLSNPPNLSQGMIERVGQVVYVHPVVQDMVQMDAVPHVPQPVLAPHQILIPKHDGFVFSQPPQLSLTPPAMQQQFPLPGHLQVSQPPFPAICPITVLASNGPYDVKLL
ncbi:Polyadenylate-binding protein-interacting protein 4-like protein [Drosera capensis]